MNRISYPSDLTNEQWKLLKRILPPPSGRGRKRTVDLREVLNGIFYLLRTGCQWRQLPHEFPAWQTVYGYFWRWQKSGLFEQLNARLRERVRQTEGRRRQPSAAIIDSQSVKTTEVGGLRGYDAGKKINGRKRHALVDTLPSVRLPQGHRSSSDETMSQVLKFRPADGSLNELWLGFPVADD